MNRRRAALEKLLSLGTTAWTLPALVLSHAAQAQDAKPPAQATKKLVATPTDVTGPYYPVSWEGDVDNDLVTFNGKRFAHGQGLRLSGRVLNTTGEPVSGALVQLWQCDDRGFYRHPSDEGEEPAERGFQGYGQVRTAGDGGYAFTTIKPKMYGGRPPHLHLRIHIAGQTPLTTQLYFAGENRERGLLGGFAGFSPHRELLTLKPTPGPSQSLLAAYDFVVG